MHILLLKVFYTFAALMTIKIGLIRERKQPADPRVALAPSTCAELMKKYPEISVFAESSDERIFTDEMYRNAGVEVVDDVSNCDLLLGVKEVPVEYLLEGKSYMFFSHTIKEQPYNQKMFKAILDKNIELIDYETLKFENGVRILGFGRYAGIVGAYNGILTWGKKYGQFDLKPAHKCRDFAEMKRELDGISLPDLKLVVTGNGRVSHGAIEVLDHLNFKSLSPQEYLSYKGDGQVYCKLSDGDLFERKDGVLEWEDNHFYTNHEMYNMKFHPYISETDILVNGIYWEEDLPRFFEVEDTSREDFRMKVIADVTCDVKGSIPITLRATPIHDPVIGWDSKNLKETDPFGKDSIDVMAVTNLPAELPADASEGFGSDLAEHVLPDFLNGSSDILDRARITNKKGQIEDSYSYLSEYGKG
jgi:saccharopine dehydrogenase (NAD+, L-lysine-forming)